MFNKGLGSNKKQKGILKRLKNIEDKTDNQLNRDSQSDIKSIDYVFKEELSEEAKNIFKKAVNY